MEQHTINKNQPKDSKEKIPCTVGILTFNSEGYLERCLKSVDEFADIVLADGGSSDRTLDIARQYGCRVVSQSNPGHPIVDFSKERNIMLDAARCDWFFYLDSDEIMSHELKEDIRRVTAINPPEHYIYKVNYRIISQDTKTVYKGFKPYYQMRLFNKKSGARFYKKVHEKIQFDQSKYSIGTVEGPWYVPLDVQLDFSIYRRKVHHRLSIQANEWKSKNLWAFLNWSIFPSTRNVATQLFKITYLRFRYKSDEIIPLRYELFRIYSQLFFMMQAVKRYARLIFGNKA